MLRCDVEHAKFFVRTAQYLDMPASKLPTLTTFTAPLVEAALREGRSYKNLCPLGRQVCDKNNVDCKKKKYDISHIKIDDTKVCKMVNTSTNPPFELACKTLEGDVLLKGHIISMLDDPSCDPTLETLVAKSEDDMFDPDGAATAKLLVKEKITDLIGSIKHVDFFGDRNRVHELYEQVRVDRMEGGLRVQQHVSFNHEERIVELESAFKAKAAVTGPSASDLSASSTQLFAPVTPSGSGGSFTDITNKSKKVPPGVPVVSSSTKNASMKTASSSKKASTKTASSSKKAPKASEPPVQVATPKPATAAKFKSKLPPPSAKKYAKKP